MMARVVLATNNAKKLAELRRLVADAGADLEVLGLADIPAYDEPVEDGSTFEANALIKARAAVVASGLPALADDSGLCVDALGGMPGIRSARWAGPQKDDGDNLRLVLAQIDDVPGDARAAHFTCAVAFVDPGGDEQVVQRTWPGVLTTEPRGDNGFGYDPIFVPAGQTRTSAEMSAAEKDAISHRGQAVRAALPVVIGALVGESA